MVARLNSSGRLSLGIQKGLTLLIGRFQVYPAGLAMVGRIGGVTDAGIVIHGGSWCIGCSSMVTQATAAKLVLEVSSYQFQSLEDIAQVNCVVQ
jgi:hypothetical protein